MNRPSLIAAVVMMALSAGAFAQQAGEEPKKEPESAKACLLYTSDAADE